MTEPETTYSVLIIDDEADIREIMEEALAINQLNIKTFTAADGAEGLKKIANQKFDLVITDLKMPVMDGKTLIKEINHLAKDVRPKNIILASGHIEKSVLKEASGSISLIRKPFSIDDLNKYVSLILTKNKRKRETQDKAKQTLNVEYINPFIDATLEVLDVMSSLKAEKDFIFIKEDGQTFGDITGIIPISSENHIGSMSITFTEKVYLKILENMLGEEQTEINNENQDGVAELCNQIFGNAKAKLNTLGYFLDMTIPTIITGHNHRINHSLGKSKVLGVFFKTEDDSFLIECVLVDKK